MITALCPLTRLRDSSCAFLQSNQKWASAKSFIGQMAQDRARQKKNKEGWEPISDTHEYRLAP